MMGGIGRTFGRLLGVKKPKVPDVVAPPKLEDTARDSSLVDEESRTALANQEARRNISAQAERSLLGTGLSQSTQDSLLGNIQETETGLVARDQRVLSDVEKAKQDAKKKRERAAAAAAAAQPKTFGTKFRKLN